MLTPSSASTSAEPLRLVTLRLPCLATGTPTAAITRAAVVLTLNSWLPPPPVPTVVLGASHTRPARSSAGDTGTTLTAADLSPSDDERHTRQEALANKSPFGSFLLVEDAGSSIQHWDPDAVIAAVESVLASPNLKSS